MGPIIERFYEHPSPGLALIAAVITTWGFFADMSIAQGLILWFVAGFTYVAVVVVLKYLRDELDP